MPVGDHPLSGRQPRGYALPVPRISLRPGGRPPAWAPPSLWLRGPWPRPSRSPGPSRDLPDGPERERSSRWNGSKSRSTSPAAITGPLLPTVTTAEPPSVRHDTAAHPRDVVAQRVVDEVGDEPLDQAGITHGHRRSDLGSQDQALGILLRLEETTRLPERFWPGRPVHVPPGRLRCSPESEGLR